ncbi:uncharacterized protein LOC143533156 [Bidens hawaiensis]|uniref:uncharacterized protein LOC143533156 n=1 Tax=Bidens hawaiensis TaxID=980011 RepID=UPI004049CF82
MFSEWFKCNQNYPQARTLSYVEFPTKFVWKADKRYWKPRKKGFSIGRIHAVSPSLGEAYYLRILLNKVKGPTTFAQIRTVNSVEYPTFRDACYACGLLDDDNEYVEAIVEASFTGTGYYLRSLFCTLLMSESMSRPEFVWESLELNEEQFKNLTLFEIEKFLLRNNSTLKKFSTMPFPNQDSISSANNLLLSEELAYDNVINCKVLKLTKNLRLSTSIHSTEIEQTKLFAQWLLDIGEGNVGGTNDGEAQIEIPQDLLIKHSSDPVSELIDFVYPSILQNFQKQNYFYERAILAPKNDIVQEIDDRLLSIFPGEERKYLSSNSVCPTDMINENLDESLCSPDILNGIKASGLPNHKLVLKVGVPVMLLRNIDQKSGLCNGTRLKVVSLGKRIIQVEIISGSNIGDRHYIPRITLIPTDKKIHIKLQRRQYPLALCFAMTINKSQGQSLSRVGLYLKKPVFTHGQLYVALLRVTRRDGLKVLILDSDGNPSNETSNVVYKEVFRSL